MLRPELAAVIGAERFLREIKTIANLQHPHILGLIDSGEVERHRVLRDAVRGGRESCATGCTREKQLPIADAVRIATEVAGALDYAHRHGVIHRDIKPENVMLHDGSALVADFGIALAVSSAGGGSRMTETGMSLGTPHYMSPEQAMGEREITARSDVYALGAMTYEMLVGEPPFTGPTAQAIVAKVMTAEPAGAHRPAPERSARGRGRGAHRAGQAAGRPLRQRGGIRRGAGDADDRHPARDRDRGGPARAARTRGGSPRRSIASRRLRRRRPGGEAGRAAIGDPGSRRWSCGTP